MTKSLRTFCTLAAAAVVLASTGPARADGPVVGWGDDSYGQRTPPDSVNGAAGTASAIAAGGGHSCAIQAGTGAVVCWGKNNNGQRTPPTSVNGIGGTATAITAGGDHSCAIQAGTGAAVCWGGDYLGQAAAPDSVNGTAGTASAIAAGHLHSCAIQAGTAAVVCWGDDRHGQKTPPDSVNGSAGTATAIAAGGWHSCAIQAGSGAVVCWGLDESGRATPPDSVNGTAGTASAIAAGYTHSCAIQAGSGAVACWGVDHDGRATPPDSVNGSAGTARAIAVSERGGCAIQASSGAVVCWGPDGGGLWMPPPSVTGGTGTASAIAAGNFHALAIRVAPLARGDLLVTDLGRGRVVRIGPGGLVDTFSPPPGGTNHLVTPAGITVAPDGDAYVVDTATDRLVRIDGRTGAQSIVRESDLDPFGDPDATYIGDQPRGLDVFEDILGLQHFYVSAANGLHVASEQLLGDGYVGSLVDATLPSTHFGVGLQRQESELVAVWIAAGSGGVWSWNASDDTADQFLPAASGEVYLDVGLGDGQYIWPIATRVEMPGFGDCAPGTGALIDTGSSQILSEGGLLRCPIALAENLQVGGDSVYVADTATLLFGGDGRVVKLEQNGCCFFEQSLFVDAATLDVALPGGIAYVPEPDVAALGAMALAALAAIRRACGRTRRDR